LTVRPLGTRHPLTRDDFAAEFVSAIAAVIPSPSPLHEPEFSGNEIKYVEDCIATGWVSSVGGYVDRFEKDLGEFTGSAHVIAAVNGTAALHLCLVVANVGAGDEVIVPALSFVATANAVSYLGATCHFADISSGNWGLDPQSLENGLMATAVMRDGVCFNQRTSRPIRAVICMHTFGHPADLDPIVEVCERWNLTLIEDAAQSLGSLYKSRHTGNHGALSALSFNGNKILTTGGGGAILTNDAKMAATARHLSTTAKIPHAWEYAHDQIGFNYRMPNLNAALGCGQLEHLAQRVDDKRRLASLYAQAFETIQGAAFIVEPDFARSNYWLNAVLLDNPNDLAPVLERSNAVGLGTRPAWQLLHQQAMYRDCPRMDLSIAEDYAGRLVNIPSSAKLGRRSEA